jgi:threonyl-tRNA synthetase
VPIADRHFEFARKLAADLTGKDYRVEVDVSNKRMQAKIALAEEQKIPYILVIGDKDIAASAVSVRLRGKVDLGAKPIAEFVAMLEQVVNSRTLKLTP